VKSPLRVEIESGPNRAGSAVRVMLLDQEAVITAPQRNWLKWVGIQPYPGLAGHRIPGVISGLR
jgi:hypothetical protein